MFVRIIDENGFFLEDAFVEELTERTIPVPCPDGFYLPKWDGEKWVEGKTQAEIDAIKSIPIPPTQDEVIADLISLLVAQGVIVNV